MVENVVVLVKWSNESNQDRVDVFIGRVFATDVLLWTSPMATPEKYSQSPFLPF